MKQKSGHKKPSADKVIKDWRQPVVVHSWSFYGIVKLTTTQTH
ncbi:MAG: hypothetical protein P8Y67_12960 [Alphaproteobacteria bacterium]